MLAFHKLTWQWQRFRLAR